MINAYKVISTLKAGQIEFGNGSERSGCRPREQGDSGTRIWLRTRGGSRDDWGWNERLIDGGSCWNRLDRLLCWNHSGFTSEVRKDVHIVEIMCYESFRLSAFVIVLKFFIFSLNTLEKKFASDSDLSGVSSVISSHDCAQSMFLPSLPCSSSVFEQKALLSCSSLAVDWDAASLLLTLGCSCRACCTRGESRNSLKILLLNVWMKE